MKNLENRVKSKTKIILYIISLGFLGFLFGFHMSLFNFLIWSIKVYFGGMYTDD